MKHSNGGSCRPDAKSREQVRPCVGVSVCVCLSDLEFVDGKTGLEYDNREKLLMVSISVSGAENGKVLIGRGERKGFSKTGQHCI